MAYTGLITKAVAAASVAIAGMTGVGTVVKVARKPMIEGVGNYDQPVKAGDVVPIEWTIIKRTDCGGELGRVWVGQDGFYLVEAMRQSALPASDAAREYSIQTQVPILAPPGGLLLSIKGVYNCPRGDAKFELGPVSLEVVE